jgi:uncharacterized protein (DUF1697 family)
MGNEEKMRIEMERIERERERERAEERMRRERAEMERRLQEERQRNKIILSPQDIEKEIKIWESIKSCGYSERSSIFRRNIDVDDVLTKLYKAKKDDKTVEITTHIFYVNYLSEEEKREIERKEKERREAERREAERREAEKKEKERIESERREAEKREKENIS